MTYNHDMLHFSQSTCSKKDTCYRYWLGQEVKNRDYMFASFFHPEKQVLEGCKYYIKNE